MSISLNTPWPAAPAVSITVDVAADVPGGRPAEKTTMSNAAALPHLQALCERYGVRPTYLVSFPALTDHDASAFLRAMARSGRCEIGTLLQTWTTPPLGPSEGSELHEPAQPTLELLVQKLEVLTEEIRTRLGVRPVTLRGRGFGMTADFLRVLPDHGYLIDTSVTPLRSWRATGGPDLSRAPRRPYRPCVANPAREGDGEIIEVPESVLPARGIPAPLRRFIGESLGPRSAGESDPHGPVWLDPTWASRQSLLRAVERLEAERTEVFNICVPSNGLFPGASPRAPTRDAVQSAFRRLQALLQRLVVDRGAVGRTMSELLFITPECLRNAPSEQQVRDAERERAALTTLPESILTASS